MGKFIFFNGVTVGISTTLQGQPPCSGAISQQKLDIMLFLSDCFSLFKKEKDNEIEWVWMWGRIWEQLGWGKNVMKIYPMKFSKK